MIRVTSDLRMPGLNAYIGKVQDAAEHGAEEAAVFLAAEWVSRAHVITGAYKASIYVQTHTASQYGRAAAAFRAHRQDMAPLPEPPKPARKGAASVQSAAPYAKHEELGTRYRTAHPAFTSAVDLTRRAFAEIMRKRLVA